MKTIRIFSITVLLMAIASLAFAQTKEESFKVSGNCGMCKSKIEKAAKSAGATYALWDKDTKIITIKYDNASTNTAKIQEKIAEVGYDNAGFKATDDAYNKLHGCCKYERQTVKKDGSCCSEKCEMKDGKCVDMAACKDKDCCKDSEKCKESGCCSAAKEDGAMACCKKDGDKASCCAKKAEHDHDH